MYDYQFRSGHPPVINTARIQIIMKLVTVEATFTADTVDQAIRSFNDLAEKVRGMEGCDHYVLYKNGASVGIIQRWETIAHFDAYRQSDAFRALGSVLKPFMTVPPVTTAASVDNA